MKRKTRETYEEAKARFSKHKEKMLEAEKEVKEWENAEKQTPAPPGYEIVAFEWENEGVFPVMRKKPEETKAKAS